MLFETYVIVNWRPASSSFMITCSQSIRKGLPGQEENVSSSSIVTIRCLLSYSTTTASTNGMLEYRRHLIDDAALFGLDHTDMWSYNSDFCLLAAVSSATVMGISLSKLTASVGVIAGSSSCVVHNAPAYFYAFWIPMLASECMLCGLAILRGIQTCFPASTLFQSGRRLVKALVRDAILYFIVVFGVYLVNAIVFIVTTGNELETTVSFTAACSCVLCNRMSLNIRGMVREDNSIPDLTPSPLKNDSSYSSSEIPVEGTESALMEEVHGSQDWREDIVSRV
ncbi:hypothetical protein A0H81_02261 [Grifola frondosa]|uniref:Uncharacterized protein n=1 Tax=Grifola frondosa TaxID=5627 RepID=A0A1C7MN99_GRIFR|nr:hypothetical protein A0H81_02261 [Grifola frondosa]